MSGKRPLLSPTRPLLSPTRLGKWHLGDSPGPYPIDQSFDSWWGFPFSTNVASYRSRVGFDPKVSKVPMLMEGRRGEAVRETEPCTLDNRPLIEQRITEKAREYIEAHRSGERPFFLFVSRSLMHHPYLPNPEFAGKSGNGPFADMMVEHDHRVGQVLDSIEAARLSRKTLVVYASDNGPDSANFPTVSNSGPYRGYLGSAFESAIRTPLLVRWPGQVPAGASSNEIVSMVDLFPTLAKLAGAEVPGDREIDGRDKSALLLGQSTKSARESVLVFSRPTLLAVKWRTFKVFLTGDDPAPSDRHWERLWAPRAFNVEQDPREENNIAMENLWLLEPVMREVYTFLFSLAKEGLILPGGEVPEEANVEIPFQSPDELQRSMSAIRWNVMK